MTDRPLANLAESVRQRLLNQARATGEDFQIVLTSYLFERFLYPLSRSEARDRHVRKVTLLLDVWLDANLASARELLPILRSFLLPPLEALSAGRAFEGTWPEGGPWSAR